MNASAKIAEIKNLINTAAGIVDGNIDGVWVWYEVKEMQEKVGFSSWKTQPSGRFQINVSHPGERRDRIFRTKKADGSFNVLDVVEAIKSQHRARKSEIDREVARKSNADVAEAIRTSYVGKTKYISSYASSTSTFVAPSSVEGKVAVQINFGSVDPEVARKIMAFVNALEA